MPNTTDATTWAATLQLLAHRILSDEKASRERMEYAVALQHLAAETLVSAGRRPILSGQLAAQH